MTSLELQQRMALERLIVRHLIDTAINAGWTVRGIDDGGNELVHCANADEAMEAVFAVDDSRIYFAKDADGKKAKGMVAIILGNGVDCICDHSIGEAFEREIMDVSTAYVDSLNDTGVAGMYALEVQNNAQLLDALVNAKWMLERDYIDDQKMAVIRKCEEAIAMAKGEAA